LKPSIGDQTDATGTHPGFHYLSLDFAYGSTHEPFTTILQPREINVGGRCGTNVPFPEAVFTASSVQAGTLIGIDATTSSDADNDPLTFLPSSDTSTGCGLQQQLTYAWFLETRPSGSAADVLLGTGTAQFTFTPDLPGGYDLALHVTDDTAPPAGTRTGTQTFHVAASARLAFASAPTSGTTNFPLTDVTVTFTDALGATCVTCTGTVTLSATGGTGTLAGTLQQTGTGFGVCDANTEFGMADWDFDGIPDPPAGLEDVSKLPRITEELLRRGHSEEEVRKVLGENFLRFFARVEEVSRSLAAEPPATEVLP